MNYWWKRRWSWPAKEEKNRTTETQLVKLLELREANHVEFCRIKNVADEILQLYGNSELNSILKLLMEPSGAATGLKIEFDALVCECEWISNRISEVISLDGALDQEISSYPLVPTELFEDIESSWKGRVRRIHLEELYAEVEQAAHALNLAVTEDFLPVISRIRATTAPLGGPRGEILYSREHEAVWLKGKRFVPSVWAGTPGEQQIRQLRPSVDSKGKKVGEEWFTTQKVEDALMRYHNANEKAKAKVLELLRGLSSELQSKINILVFSSMLLVTAKALFAHVSEGRRRKWVLPTLAEFNCAEDGRQESEVAMTINGLIPYWFDVAKGSPVHNEVHMQSLFLLTGPNGGGKSSLLRSACAAALLGICGLMVPAESALIPHFDAIFLHMKSYDSPADGKSSFQIEMSEIRSIISATTSRSLVLIDEICRGTETAKGTCIAGSIIETLDTIGCLGIISTHLHGIFDLPLSTSRTVNKAMGIEYINGQVIPTWKLMNGVCRESLAFETAQKEGVPVAIVQRAEELYHAVYEKNRFERTTEADSSNSDASSSFEACSLPGKTVVLADPRKTSAEAMEILQKEVRTAIATICQRRLLELYTTAKISKVPQVNCVSVAAREQPPPSTIGASSVYVMLQPDKKLYVGQTDDLQGRVRAHRSKEGMVSAGFLYFLVSGKSLACQLETLLINQLPSQGFKLTNIADGKHRNFGSSDLSLESTVVCR